MRAAVCLLLAGGFAAAPARSPKLTVVLVAEQFRADWLDRYRADFGEGGLRRLLESGAAFRSCRFDYPTTWAAPGAATLATGTYPSEHGVVAEAWYDRERGETVEAVAPGDAASPAALIGSTFADELMLASGGRSRVVALGDRAAPTVLLAGRRPDACYWRGRLGEFRTSGYYRSGAADWVQDFNRERLPKPAGKRAWTAIDAEPGAPPLRTLDSKDFLRLYRASPFAVEDLFDLARAAVEAKQLGQRDYPDLLVLTFESSALLALETGAESPLMRDWVLRFDRSLAEFLEWLDPTVSLDELAVVFAATHGSPPSAEKARGAGLPSGRVSGRALAQAAQDRLALRFPPATFVEKFIYPFLYLSEGAMEGTRAEREARLRAAGEAALTIPGVAGYDSPEASSVSPQMQRRMARSRFPGRSGDLMVVYRPYWSEEFAGERGVSSGSPYRYDTDTPLLLFGRRFRQGVIERPADPRRLAPTLTSLLEVATPSSAVLPPMDEILLAPEAPAVGPPPPPAND